MRDDHTTINYAIGWGQTTPKEPFLVDIKPADWGKIVELETEWKKQQKYI
jgi:branched-chain amino acid transport system substrate-binding protein